MPASPSAVEQSVTPDQVSAVLGEVDGAVMARILAVAASLDELQEAVGGWEDEAGFGGPHPASSPRVVEIRALLDEISAAEDTGVDE